MIFFFFKPPMFLESTIGDNVRLWIEHWNKCFVVIFE